MRGGLAAALAAAATVLCAPAAASAPLADGDAWGALSAALRRALAGMVW
jgi:hypothetical protein